MRISRAIHVFSTGGTIDSYYKGAVDTVVPNRKSVIPDFFKDMRINRRMKYNTICLKDSRDLLPSDREYLLHRITASPYKKIVVTHGTYTMAETAQYLQKQLPEDNNRVIVLTGALVPLKGFAPSDGSFNLGYCVSQLDILRPGVYICFGGETYRQARFEEFAERVKTELKSQFSR